MAESSPVPDWNYWYKKWLYETKQQAAKIEALEAELERIKIERPWSMGDRGWMEECRKVEAQNKRLLGLIDEADHDHHCPAWANDVRATQGMKPEKCICLKSKAVSDE